MPTLYLLRHADALPLGDDIADDEARPLSPKGVAQIDALGGFWAKHLPPVQAVLTSPLTRAFQTAGRLAPFLGLDASKSVICPDLAPAGSFRKLARAAQSLGLTSMILVGHQPDLGELVGWFCGSRKARIDLPKAGVACLEFEGEVAKASAALEWLVGPAWFQGPA